jgi:hypothetical protein
MQEITRIITESETLLALWKTHLSHIMTWANASKPKTRSSLTNLLISITLEVLTSCLPQKPSNPRKAPPYTKKAKPN